MAINRVLNAIWAEISARGSLIKAATDPYQPSPGSEDDNANNQGLAALQATSPFIELDPDGHSAAMPVTAALGDEGSYSPDPLDENSGKFHVTRQYGDIYLFNDGNVIAWGGNGKNFSFGNGYEENHAWAGQCCVYNNEVFAIPAGAMSTPDCFDRSSKPDPSPTDGVAEYEWLGGNVSKSWGVDYSYSYGTAYEWSAGPNVYIDAYGNPGKTLKDVKQGKHCTYSYGTGYEEALIAWDNGSGWFHADDSNSPYVNRQHDTWQSSYLSAQGISASMTPIDTSGLLDPARAIGELEQLVQEVFVAMDFAARNAWTADNLLVSKAFGNTYDYHYGRGLSIQEGPSEERVYGNSSATVVGDSTENVTGNSSETVTGNSSSNVTGNSDENITGNATSMVKGNSTEQFWGGKAEFFMGGKSEMSLGACDEINLAAKVEIVAGVALEIFLGFKTEIGSAGSLEFELGPKLTLTPADAELKEATAKIEVLEAGQMSLANLSMTMADMICNL